MIFDYNFIQNTTGMRELRSSFRSKISQPNEELIVS